MRKSYESRSDRRGVYDSQTENSIERYVISWYHAAKLARKETLLCVASGVGRRSIRTRTDKRFSDRSGVATPIRPRTYVYILERTSRCSSTNIQTEQGARLAAAHSPTYGVRL